MNPLLKSFNLFWEVDKRQRTASLRGKNPYSPSYTSWVYAYYYSYLDHIEIWDFKGSGAWVRVTANTRQKKKLAETLVLEQVVNKFL